MTQLWPSKLCAFGELRHLLSLQGELKAVVARRGLIDWCTVSPNSFQFLEKTSFMDQRCTGRLRRWLGCASPTGPLLCQVYNPGKWHCFKVSKIISPEANLLCIIPKMSFGYFGCIFCPPKLLILGNKCRQTIHYGEIAMAHQPGKLFKDPENLWLTRWCELPLTPSFVWYHSLPEWMMERCEQKSILFTETGWWIGHSMTSPGIGAPAGWLIRIDGRCWTCFGQTTNLSNELSKGGVIPADSRSDSQDFRYYIHIKYCKPK